MQGKEKWKENHFLTTDARDFCRIVEECFPVFQESKQISKWESTLNVMACISPQHVLCQKLIYQKVITCSQLYGSI